MSAILSAETLNDFIAPSVVCIKPVETLPPPPPSELAVSIEDDKTPSDARTTAQISLTDCLACSGCVTSSEAVLVSMQSHNEVLSALTQFPDKKFVALLSPQTRAALAVALGGGVSEAQVGNVVVRLLTQELVTVAGKGFEAVLDTNPFRRLAHHYAAAEVVEVAATAAADRKKPVLASSCPGFICYLESTHPELILHLSSLKSPQAIAGTFIKSLLIGEGAVKSPEDVYVVSIMPCFDKKLEGARGELTSAIWRKDGATWGETLVRDVDCVITTREILSLADAKGIDFTSLSRAPVPTPTISADPTIQDFLTAPTRNGVRDAGTSGGTLAAIISELLAKHPESTLNIQQGRNIDTVEYLVLSPSGGTIAKLSRCYGFRNIQNLVRRLKPAKTRVLPQFGSRKPAAAATAAAARRIAAKKTSEAKDDKAVYVEVMACPGGCTNGGGQIKWDDEVLWKELGLDKWATQRELLSRVDEAYFSDAEGGKGETAGKQKKGDSEVQAVVSAWSRISGVSEDKLVRTTYRKVANDIGGRLGDQEVLELASRTGGGW